MKKLLLVAFSLAIGFGAKAQSYTPVAVTGYNADVVANGAGTVISSTTHDVDGVNYNFVAQNFVNPANASPTSALPTSGTITSAVAATPGLTYQLAPYTGNNSLRISGIGSGTLSFATPTSADQVFVLATSGSGASTSVITVTFTDGSTQVFTQAVSDWYDATGFAIQGISRVNRTNDAIENSATNPRLYQYLLPLSIANTTKTIQSITFTKTTAGGVLNVMGISVRTAPAPAANDAGILAVVAPTSPVQAGVSTPVQVTLVNQGTTNLTSATITWTVDGAAQTPYAWTGNLALNQTATVTIGNFTFVPGAPVLNVCATNPNNTTDGFAANDCAQVTLNACNVLAGAYTIDKTAAASATNFTSLAAAVTAMSSCGISAPVVFNVIAGTGPYLEQLDIPAIAGVTAANTITFNGNGNAINADPVSATRAVIKLNGADYITINNFVIATTGTGSSSYGWGVFFTNGADNNTISNNTITIGSASATESTSSGIVFSNSTTSVVSTGNNGSNNIISGNTITGGYNGIVLYGLNTSTGNNQITGNTIKDFYATGVKLGSAMGTLVENNNISRPTRTGVTTFEGVTMNGTTQNSIISKNRIHTSHGGATTLSGTVYGVYSTSNDAPAGAENLVKNNLIYNINNTGTVYGLYNTGSDGVYYYHNTVNLDHTANTGTIRGFYQTTLASNIKLRNNIINISAGTSGVKHAIYYGTTTSSIESDRNDLFVTGGATGSGTGFFTSNRVTLADWQTASGDDANSVSADPLFSTTPSNNFTPTNVALNNIGLPVTPAVTDDITGAARSATTPDPGAVEFTVASVDMGAVALALPTVKSCYGSAEQVTITIKNWGSSPLDFATTNVTVSANVTGAATQTFPIVTLNSNALNGGQPLVAGATVDVPVGTLNMTAVGVYTFNASTAVTTGGSDGNTANNAMTAESITTVPVASGTASATFTSLCQSGTTTLNLAGHAGGTIQWQQASALAGPFTDITGATAASFTPATALTATTYFRNVVSCGTNTDTSNVITVTVNNPQAPVATGDTRCGSGTVNLSATPSAGAVLNWYTVATGGVPVATGTTYSPNVTATTTYYAASSLGGNTESVGIVNGGTSSYIDTDIGRGLKFTATVPFTLNSVYVYPTGTGTITIRILDMNNTILYTAQPVSISGTGTQKILVPVNLAIPAGTYKIGMASTGITNLVRESGNATFPYTSPSGAVSITTGVFGTNSTTATSYYWFYDWSISTGCESARTPVVATVNPAPVVNLGADVTQCGANPVLLDAGNAGATYQWSLNGTVIPNATFQTLSVTTGGTYSVSVTSGGCSGTDDVIVSISAAPAKPVITVAAGGNTTICQGSSVTLNGASTTTGVTYTWSLNGAPIAGATTASYTATQAGNYRVIATSGGCSDSSVVTAVTVNAVPATPVITQTGAVLNSSASAGNQWYLNGNPIAGATATTFTPAVSGTYTVIATANGCSSLVSNSLNVTITGLGPDQSDLQISVYPNPSAGVFNVALPAGKTYMLTVTDLAGKLVKSQTVEKNNALLQLDNVAKGIYLLQVRSEGKLAIHKLVIQ